MPADPRDWSEFGDEYAEAYMFFVEHVLPDIDVDPDDEEAVIRAFTKWKLRQIFKEAL